MTGTDFTSCNALYLGCMFWPAAFLVAWLLSFRRNTQPQHQPTKEEEAMYNRPNRAPSVIPLTNVDILIQPARTLALGYRSLQGYLENALEKDLGNVYTTLTGNTTGTLAAPSDHPNLVAYAHLVRVMVGRDQSTGDITVALDGFRLGSVVGATTALAASTSFRPIVAGEISEFLVFAADTVQQAENYPVPY